MENEVVVEPTLRETLAESLKTYEAPVETEPAITTPEARARDGQGKFAKVAPVEAPVVEPIAEPVKVRPSTWKKDYWDKYDKLDPDIQGYIVQRENEYKAGVSTYKQAADEAKGLQDAIAPFIPELQQYKIDPRDWIQNLGNAHRVLALGTQEQKQAKLMELIAAYGIALPNQQGQVDPTIQALMQQVNELRGSVTSFQSNQQLIEQQKVQAEIQSFAAQAEKHPHFEQVKERMAGFLQAGLAPDLEAAYKMAVRTDDTLFEQIQQAHSASLLVEKQQKAAQIAKEAKAKVVSVKGGSPTSQTTTQPDGLRDVIRSQVEGLRARI